MENRNSRRTDPCIFQWIYRRDEQQDKSIKANSLRIPKFQQIPSTDSMAVSCKTTIKKDVRKKHSRPSVVDDLKGTPTFDKESKFLLDRT